MADLRTRVTLHRTLAHERHPIERIEEGEKVRYTNIMLLGPGEWTDAASRTTLYYAPDAIKRSAGNWVDPRTGEAVTKAPLNHNHDHGAPSENIGHIPVDSVWADEQGHLFSDVVFHMKTSRSQEMEAMMKLAMDTDGEEGLGGISVEIPSDETTWDDTRNLERMVEMWFSGAGVVQHPASATVAFGKQAERARAMSADANNENVDVEVLMREGGERTKPDAPRDEGMQGDSTYAKLRTLRERADEMARELQDETDVALTALKDYLSVEAHSESDALSQFQAWASDALEDELASMVSAAVNSYMEGSEGEIESATVGDFMGWVEGTAEDEAEPEAPQNPSPPPAQELADGMPGDGVGNAPADGAGGNASDEESAAAELEAVLDTLMDVIATLRGDVAEAETVAENTMQENQQLREAVSDLERRLEDLEDEPQPKTLSGEAYFEDDDEDGEVTTAPTPVRTGDGYISR
ncbi:MAG: hypothetical protein R3324_00440 [Halobacteriales archaeon]|nr:hypothetical protein [Halobacteriales archaeon]